MCIIIVVSSNLAGRKQCNQGSYKKIEQSAKQTPNVGLSKSPICPVTWDFQHEPSLWFFKAKALKSPSKWCRIFSPSVGKASSVLTALQICYVLCFGMYAVVIAVKQLWHMFFSPFTWAIGRVYAPSVVIKQLSARLVNKSALDTMLKTLSWKTLLLWKVQAVFTSHLPH